MREGPVRIRVLLSGRVQGVAFRAYAVEQARQLGVAGWIRNLPDGRVEAVAEGERALVEAMVAWLREGPRLARVEDVEVFREEPEGLQVFDIRR